MDPVATTIAAELARWDEPGVVEDAIWGTVDPATISASVRAFCRAHLRALPAAARFYTASIGSVFGLELDDGRAVVLKAHQPQRDPVMLAEIQRVQQHLHDGGFPAPRPLVPPRPLGLGHATVEELLDAGQTADTRQPELRRATARELAALVARCRALVEGSTLPPHLLPGRPAYGPWPTPHSRLFDFVATSPGAEKIAREARQRLSRPFGDLVIGHGDWRAEHLRWDGTRLTAAFDWDSLCKERETVLVGFTAHAFGADWSRDDPRQAPTLDEAQAFVAEYESARNRPFGAGERSTIAAAFAYSVAYTARCGHALGQPTPDGSFGALLALEGGRLFFA